MISPEVLTGDYAPGKRQSLLAKNVRSTRHEKPKIDLGYCDRGFRVADRLNGPLRAG